MTNGNGNGVSSGFIEGPPGPPGPPGIPGKKVFTPGMQQADGLFITTESTR